MPAPQPRHRRIAALLAVLVVAAMVMWPTAAGAHSDDGAMEVIAAAAPAPLRIEVEVGVVYANDDDLATDASVTVTATGPAGETIGPVEVPNREDAVYAASFDVPMPGTWTLAFTAVGPAASATADVVVDDAGSTTTTGSPTGGTTTSPTSDRPDTPAEDDAASGGTDAEDDDGSALPLVVGAVVVISIGAAVALVLRSRSAGRGIGAP